MYYSPVRHSSPKWSVRLACIRHAASVHPEPGSNSPLSYFFQTTLVCLALFYFLNLIDVVFYSFLFSFQCPLTWLSRRVPIYITILSPFCKAFSCSFFIFFSISLFFCLYINVFLSHSFFTFFSSLSNILCFYSKRRLFQRSSFKLLTNKMLLVWRTYFLNRPLFLNKLLIFFWYFCFI